MSVGNTTTKWVFEDEEALTKAMQAAVRAAIRRHKLLGNPIAVSDDDGNVVIIQPENIVVDDDDS